MHEPDLSTVCLNLTFNCLITYSRLCLFCAVVYYVIQLKLKRLFNICNCFVRLKYLLFRTSLRESSAARTSRPTSENLFDKFWMGRSSMLNAKVILASFLRCLVAELGINSYSILLIFQELDTKKFLVKPKLWVKTKTVDKMKF